MHQARMNILHLSTNDIGGGAAVSAYRLHIGLRRLGLNSQMLVSGKNSDDFTVFGATSSLEKLWSRLAAQLDALPRRLLTTPNASLISPALVWENTAKRALALNPEIIHLHWTQGGFLRPSSVLHLARTHTPKPIVWTLHDMWAFCGGEHYVGDDTRYQTGYRADNRPKGEAGFDLNRWLWNRKRRAWKNLDRFTRITIVTPSKWLADCARKSVLLGQYTVLTIPYGIDLERFKPISKRAAREILNLPHDKTLIMFGAMSATSDLRKGFQFLRPTLDHLAQDAAFSAHTELVIFGSSEPRNPERFGFNTTYLGRLTDEISIALAYSAADVFVAPSTEDNLPNTVLESLACGTPVVAFHIGGMPDMIDHEHNGYLAHPFDVEDLAHGIRSVLASPERLQELSQAARAKAEREFPLTLQASRYHELYRSLLETS